MKKHWQAKLTVAAALMIGLCSPDLVRVGPALAVAALASRRQGVAFNVRGHQDTQRHFKDTQRVAALGGRAETVVPGAKSSAMVVCQDQFERESVRP